ncbi:hypothetical protein [Rhizobium leguminosarum]|uniref:hypothetical protein n=1 Tax=Rhizobium leguminosarum TaxID=384 RepID=UPI00056B93CD|nr:hypothetical protein [Rhizobium leguminosarum]
MVADSLCGRKLRQCHSDEIVEIVVDDRRALKACRAILEFKRAGGMPLAVKNGFELLIALTDPFSGSIKAFFKGY